MSQNEEKEKLLKSIHRTSTGKIFMLMDLSGDPIDYQRGKDIFDKRHLADLEVNQILRAKKAEMMLQRLK